MVGAFRTWLSIDIEMSLTEPRRITEVGIVVCNQDLYQDELRARYFIVEEHQTLRSTIPGRRKVSIGKMMRGVVTR